jgi:crotonobetainyl-CoA:carnitine CoA-transferase CaiB-like acyl-CoA transferase
MCRALDRQDLIDDSRFKTVRDRSINGVERREIVSAELEKWTAGEILPRLLANDVPSARALSRFELLQESQVRESGILEEHQSEKFGTVRLPRPAAQFDRTPARIRAMAPLLGEDSTTILAELGYAPDDIARLERDGVVRLQSIK